MKNISIIFTGNLSGQSKKEVTCNVGIPTIWPLVGHNCSGFHPGAIYVKLLCIPRIVWVHLQSGRACHGEKEHKLPFVCPNLKACGNCHLETGHLGCGDAFWEIKRKMEVPPKKKWLQAGAEQEDCTDLLCAP